MLEIKMRKAHLLLALEQKEHGLVLVLSGRRLGRNGQLLQQIWVPAPAHYPPLVTQRAGITARRISHCRSCT